ncbi:MFS transporter [Komagataeibacter oboediens]|uniref:MFS transporter n=1 Tax=Komagataeibacter oboediens TaxID=65958 RepID=UPI00190525BD|nr:MFS transporter [Komagataeibacter oboediens]GCE79108.1 major facilitator superfamily transporter [Komagataeibacter oboediens]
MNRDKTFNIGLILIIYLYAAASMAVVGLVVPFIHTIADIQHVSPGVVGKGLSFFALPAAILSFIFGMTVDRIGVRRSFALSVFLTVAGDVLLMSAHDIWPFRIGLMLAGCGFAYATTTSPALLMNYLPQDMRSRALAFWSTFAPAGYSAGLLLAVPFLHNGNWAMACLFHIGLMVIALVGGWMFLMRLREDGPAREAAATENTPQVRPAFARVLTLSLSVALPNGIAYGTSLVAPTYLAHAHSVSLGTTSTEVALIKIVVMLLGGGLISLLASTQQRALMLFVIMAAVGMGAQFMLFFPPSGIILASVGLFVWMFAYSSLSGSAMSLLPAVAGSGNARGVVSGIVGQFISVSSVLVPSLYFSTTTWTDYLLFAVIALVAATALLFLTYRAIRQPRLAVA